MGVDRSRSRKPNLLANPALIRNALLALLALLPDPFPNDSLPEIREPLRSRLAGYICLANYREPFLRPVG